MYCIFLKKLHNNNKGQAIAEVAICLIPLMLIICFMIFFTVLNRESIVGSLYAQKQLANGVSNKSPQAVEYITKGEDELNFTPDDEYVLGYSGNPGIYNTELKTTPNPENRNYEMSATGDGQLSVTDKNYVINKEFSELPQSFFYLSAADLRGYEDVSDDVLSKHDLDSILEVLNSLIGVENDFNVKETIYSPRKKYSDN